MDGVSFGTEHPKKRRRRDPSGQWWSARLILDDSLQGDIGAVSEHLWVELGASDTDNESIVSFERSVNLY